MLLSYAVSFLIGNEWLKDLIARPRPCAVDETVSLIVKRPSSFSCPSVHTYLAFSDAMAVCHYFKKAGIGVFAFAAMVGLSRMFFLYITRPTFCSGRLWALRLRWPYAGYWIKLVPV